MSDESKRWDVFISHASEDKDDIVRPLAANLIERGVKVWIDEQSLLLGDSLREKIDAGLAQSRYGIVVLSPFFFSKRWPAKELNGLSAKEDAEGRKVVLPIWHEVDESTVASYSPTLADRLAARTSDGLDEVVRQIMQVLRPEDKLTGTQKVPAMAALRRSTAERSPTFSLTGPERESVFEAWKLLHLALGLAADLTSPLQYRPNFRFGLREESDIREYLDALGFTKRQRDKVLSLRDPESRSREFALIQDGRRFQEALKAAHEFQNHVIEQELQLPDEAHELLITKARELQVALIPLKMALEDPTNLDLETQRQQSYERVTTLLNVGMKELKDGLRSIR
jgi:TIR domain